MLDRLNEIMYIIECLAQGSSFPPQEKSYMTGVGLAPRGTRWWVHGSLLLLFFNVHICYLFCMCQVYILEKSFKAISRFLGLKCYFPCLNSSRQ